MPTISIEPSAVFELQDLIKKYSISLSGLEGKDISSRLPYHDAVYYHMDQGEIKDGTFNDEQKRESVSISPATISALDKIMKEYGSLSGLKGVDISSRIPGHDTCYYHIENDQIREGTVPEADAKSRLGS